MTAPDVAARVTAWLDRLEGLHTAASVIGVLSEEEHRARLDAEWAVLQATPALLTLIRAVTALPEELDAEVASLATERHARTNSSARRQRGYAAGLRNAAESLRRLLADAAPDTGEETA